MSYSLLRSIERVHSLPSHSTQNKSPADEYFLAIDCSGTDNATLYMNQSCVSVALVADHPRWAFVCLSVCLSVRRSLSNTLTSEVYFRSSGTFLRNTGQVRIWRSSGQGQSHRATKVENPYSCSDSLEKR